MRVKKKITAYSLFSLFLVLWTCINLVQAALTPLIDDEAYYWMYSRYPAWGYYDHPPMIAFWIRAGYWIFKNELGVRLFTVLFQTLSFLIIWSLLDRERKKDKYFILLICGVITVLPVLNIYGFIATPDSPLLFFTALFLLVYKRFLEDESWKNTGLLSLAMAGLIYSKYHSGLLIMIVIISNLSLLRNVKFYAASFITLLLLTPHIMWQVMNNFPSLTYHLVERASGFRLINIPGYLLNQLAINNPFIFPVLIWMIFIRTNKNSFNKTLKYIIAGFFIFFFISSFRYHVQPHWTALVTIPLLILWFNNLSSGSGMSGYLKWATLLMIPVILIIRLGLIVDLLPFSYPESGFHKKATAAREIAGLAAGRPVVFTNSYQRPSVYRFYTGEFAHTLDNLNYRKTQFDLWDFEEQIHGKEILYVPHWINEYYRKNCSIFILTGGDTVFYRIYRNFQSLQKECVLLDEDRYSFIEGDDSSSIKLKIFNPYPFDINLRHNELPVVFHSAILKKGELAYIFNLDISENYSFPSPGDTIEVTCKFRLNGIPPGEYKLAICSETGMLYNTFNSRLRPLTIIPRK